jgi:hypothetical protein
MKKIFLALLVIAISIGANAQPPKGPVTPGSTYGAVITPDGAIDAAALPAQLEKSDALNTKIIGTVVSVCSKKGCWMNVKINDKENVFVQMKDYGFFVPTALVGKTVVIEGEAKMKTTSVTEQKHYAEDAKKPQAEIAAITEPKKEVSLMANGIVVVN